MTPAAGKIRQVEIGREQIPGDAGRLVDYALAVGTSCETAPAAGAASARMATS